jgi:hypothetical protein
VQARYGKEPWFKDVHGNFTYLVLGMTADEIREKGKAYRWHTPWRYDPMPTLEKLRVPQLWILGGQDLQAPSEETSRRLRTLMDSGHPITLALFPQCEHGMTQFEVAKDGERISTRYAQGYFEMMRDFALHGRLAHAYGDSILSRRSVAATQAGN